jgi:selenocysteine lyase/cysteine desulfurase
VAWQPGDNVLFCEVEFPSNAYPWMSLERDGVEVRQVPASAGGLTLPALEPLVDERTRLIAASAIQFFSGHRTDLATIGAFCRERGILFVVDAIQAIGHMAFDVQAMNIDVLASGGQKSLMAVPGIGFMYIRAPICQTLKPRFVGGNATVDYMHWLDYDMTFLPGAQRFAIGTPNLPGIFSVCASLSLLRELGVDNIDRHTSRLAAQAIDVLSGMGYEVITSRQAHGPIVTFKSGLSHQATDALVEQLQQRRVTLVKHLDAAGTPHVRLSFHCYNTTEEIEQFMQILDEARSEIGD